jgi:uncharacterized protein YfbU (UPF0304 family)
VARDTSIPLTDEGYARMLVNTEAWSWLVEWIEGQITQAKDEMSQGVPTWDEYQRLIGLVEGLPKAIQHVEEHAEEKRNSGR